MLKQELKHHSKYTQGWNLTATWMSYWNSPWALGPQGKAQGSWYPTQKSRSGHQTSPFPFSVSSARFPGLMGAAARSPWMLLPFPSFLAAWSTSTCTHGWVFPAFPCFPSRWIVYFLHELAFFFCEHISSVEVDFPQAPWIEEIWKPVMCTPGPGPSPSWDGWSQAPFPAGHPCVMKLSLEFPVSFLPHSQSETEEEGVSS